MTRAAIACALAVLLALAVRAAEPLPYLGNWSNGRGETLTITSETIQFAEDDPVEYRDVTRATDGSSFELQITTPGEINAFPGKTLALVLEDDSMQMTGYASHADYMQEKDAGAVVTWFKDDEN